MAITYVRKGTEKYEAHKLQEKIKGKQNKEIKEKTEKGIKAFKGAFKPTKTKSSRRAIARRAIGTQRLLGALGITSQGNRGRGRPTGTYKYNMPIQQYKRLQSQRRAQFDVYKQRQQADLQRKGLSPEQINQLQYIKAMQQAQGAPPQQFQQQFDVIDTPQSVMAPVDEDLEFRKFRADKTISPNTQSILRRLRYIQLKPQRDDVEMQRRLKERKMVSKAGSLLATPYVFNKYQFNMTGVKEDNILLAPNTFINNPENNILKPRPTNILTPIEEFNIMRRRPDSIRIVK